MPKSSPTTKASKSSVFVPVKSKVVHPVTPKISPPIKGYRSPESKSPTPVTIGPFAPIDKPSKESKDCLLEMQASTVIFNLTDAFLYSGKDRCFISGGKVQFSISEPEFPCNKVSCAKFGKSVILTNVVTAKASSN